MKSIITFLLFSISICAWSQDNDIYYRYTFLTRNEPVNIRVGVTGGYNVYKDYNTGNNDPVNDSGIEARKTGLNSLTFSAFMSGTNGSVSGSDYDNDISVALNSFGSFYTFLESGFSGASYFGSVALYEKMKVSIKNNPECYKNKLILSLNQDFPSAAIKWEFNLHGEGWKTISESGLNTKEIKVSLEDLIGNNLRNVKDYINKTISFRVYNELLDYVTETVEYNYLDCSVKLRENNPLQVTNAKCNGGNDGSVTLNFKEDVEKDYEMRYYIYEGEVSSFPSGEKENPNPDTSFFPQTVDNVRFSDGPSPNQVGPLKLNEDGSFGGKSEKTLGEGNYYVLYQEVKYEGNIVTVKSGKLIPNSFKVNEPTPIYVSATITQSSCNETTAQINFSASGGNNLNSTGIYSFQYQLNGDGNWQTATQNPQPVPTTEFDQTVKIKAIYSIGNCESLETTLSETINAQVPTLEFNSLTSGTASSGTASDGVISTNYSGGTPGYTFELKRLNNVSSDYDKVLNPTVFDSPFNGKVEFQNLGVGTYRIIIIDSNTCELASDDIIVSTTPLPNIDSIDTTQIDCAGNSNGAIEVDISGGVTPYNYQWTINGALSAQQSTGASTISISNLAETGDYVLKIASNGFTDFDDASGYATTTITLDAPEEVLINSAAATTISCNGAQDGGITVDLSGGDTYQYKLDFFDDWADLNSSSIPIIKGGSYDMYIRNQNGCEALPILDILVEEPDELLAAESLPDHQNVTTNNGTDGSIEVNVTGGTPFTDQTPEYYNYEWTGPNGLIAINLNVLNNLRAGTYQVKVTDANGCEVTSENIIVTQPGPLAIQSFSGTDACNGIDNGTLTAITEGTGPLTYNWILEDGTPDGTVAATTTTSERTLTIEALAPGNYSLNIVEVDTGNEVNSTQPITISEATAITATVTATVVGCNEFNTGTITVTDVSGGTPLLTGSGYEYRIDDAFNTFQADADFSGLAPRIYTVTVRDANGCEFQDTVEVIQSVPPAIDETNTIQTDATTSGGTDGTITLAFSSNDINYTYLWSGPDIEGLTTKDLIGLTAGNYQVAVSAQGNCTLVEDFTISEPGPLSILNIQAIDVLCNGDTNGSILTMVNGTGTIIYTWNRVGEGVVVGANGPDLNNIGPGTYTLTVSDETATPSVTSAEIAIGAPTVLTVQAVVTDVRCAGGADGSISLIPDGGTFGSGYSYSIDGGNTFQAQNSFNGLNGGNYDIRVQDGNGCTVDVPVTIEQPLPIGINVDLQQSLSAANTADGAISISAFGGTGALTYSWSSDNGFTSTDEDINNLAGGAYILTIRDENWSSVADIGCSFTQDFIIAEPGELVVDITQSLLLECKSDDFGEITANVQGGVAPYTYEWFEITNGNDDALDEDTEILGNLSAGNYFVRVTDANGISLDAIPLTVTEPDVLDISIGSITDVLCSGDPIGAINVSVSGGTPPYSYFWNNGATSQNLSDAESGEYTLEVIDAKGCLAEITATINPAPNAVQITDVTLTDISEYLANDGSISLDIEGGATPYTIDWIRISDNANIGNQATISGLPADAYQVSVTDANGCAVTETYEITQPDIVEETIVQPSCQGDADGSIAIIVNRGNGSFTYNWNTGATTNTIDALSAGSYTVTITGFGDGPLTRTYELLNPEPLEVDLGGDRTLCADQELQLDVTVEDETATYNWTSDNGFSSNEATVTLTQTGNYNATVSTTTGCTATGSIFVDISTEGINAEFAASTQVFVGETVVVVDISFPLPDNLEWVLPEEATVIKQDSDEVELRFSEAGEYDIGIVTSRGECIAQQTKKIIVVAPDGTVDYKDTENGRKLIEDFIIYPNPSNGKFTADINLTERGNISIKVFSFANNAMIASEKDRGELSYVIPFDLSSMPAGIYAVLLETPFGNTLRKVILK